MHFAPEMSLVTSAATKRNAVVWNPQDYAAHSAAQLVWARELIAKLGLRGNKQVLDVGCGDGKVTAELACSLPRGSAIGIDVSPQMIRFAKKTFRTGKNHNLAFHVMDARKIRFARQFDVVFSNAALHWVDDHQAVLKGAAAVLRSGGRLVVSCGGKGNAQDVFVALRGVIRFQRWRSFLRKLERPYFFHSPAEYERWLPRFGFEPQIVRLANKDVSFANRDGLVAWLRTTWLPYTQRVPAEQREAFIADVVERFVARHPADKEGRLTVRMVRLEIEAAKV